ncbi:MAG: tetratricopeptide repeat protein [Kiloniellales bacterium]
MSRGALFILLLGMATVVLSMAVAAWLSTPPVVPATPAVSGDPPVAARPNQAEILARVAALRQRIDEQPEDLEGWKMLGRSYMALGRFREAVEAWSWVKKLSPRDPQAAAALDRLAEIARKRGVHKELKP